MIRKFAQVSTRCLETRKNTKLVCTGVFRLLFDSNDILFTKCRIQAIFYLDYCVDLFAHSTH